MAKKIARPYTLENLAECSVEQAKELLLSLEADATTLANKVAELESQLEGTQVLAAELTTAKEALEEATAKIAEIEANGHLTEEQNKAVEQMAKRIVILEKENATLKATVAAPEAAPQKPTLPAESFSCTPKGEDQAQEYVFALAKFRYKGQDITAVDALTDTQLLQELVDIGSGAIKVKN